jgi:prolyl oligopeptidase
VRYPPTRFDETTDELAGIPFPDPYRWLEDDQADEVRAWQRAQADLASAHVREWPGFERLRATVAGLNIDKQVALPRYAAGRWFRTEVAPGAVQARIVTAEDAYGPGRVLFDPADADPEHPPFLSWIAPSPDGRVVAFGLCDDGSESNVIRLVDVETGAVIPDPPPHRLMDSWTGGVQWLPDSSGFFFAAIADGRASDLSQEVYLHRRSPEISTEPAGVPWTRPREYRMVTVSADGRHLVAQERISTLPIAVAELGAGPIGSEPIVWRPFVRTVDGQLAGHVVDGRFVGVTDVGAPRGRVVAIPVDSPTPDDPATWQTLVPESDAVVRTVVPVGGVLYLTELVDTYARVRIVSTDGTPLGEVRLPGRGAVAELPFAFLNLAQRPHPDRFVFGFSTLVASPAVLAHRPGEEEPEVLRGPRVRLEGVEVEDLWAVSPDGTRLPYHVLRRHDVSANAPQPTLVYAYGGFNAPHPPGFPGAMAAFVEAGGVFVHAHLRGGCEYGLDWWRGGRHENKQNTYDDLSAIAEDLIARGRARKGGLAIVGHSNGGLTAGVAATQRPDLWGAAIPRFPRLDLIGACRNAYGRSSTAIDRATNTEDPEQARRLASISPYHLVRDGIRYPAVFVDAGDTDPRCPPHDSRKFAARLQRATAGDAPILVHVWEDVGHGWATAADIAVTQHTEWLAFALRHLGVPDMPAERGT